MCGIVHPNPTAADRAEWIRLSAHVRAKARRLHRVRSSRPKGKAKAWAALERLLAAAVDAPEGEIVCGPWEGAKS